MSRNPAPRVRYMPALDGLRGLAVGAVLLYHGGVGWARGGFLGVDAFFVLSGFLITTLLFTEWRACGRIALAAFWARRARRLLPALLLMVAAIALYAARWAPADVLHRLRLDGLATLGYGANWRLMVSSQSYFAEFAVPSPFRHCWSLAIEEQFYVVWPLVLLFLLRVVRGSQRALLALTCALAGGSALLMALLASPGRDPSRVYYGTDTRAQSLLIGAALALLLAPRSGIARRAGVVLHSSAVVALLALLWTWSTVSERSTWLYEGGFSVNACCSSRS